MVTTQPQHEREGRILCVLTTSIGASSVRYPSAWRIASNERSRRARQHDLVENTVAAVDSTFARAGGTSLPSPDATHRRIGSPRGSLLKSRNIFLLTQS